MSQPDDASLVETKKILILSWIYLSPTSPIVTCVSPRKAGMNLRKVNRHVDFPLVLDLAPFCSATCKVRPPQRARH